jgi:hypothetical protein
METGLMRSHHDAHRLLKNSSIITSTNGILYTAGIDTSPLKIKHTYGGKKEHPSKVTRNQIRRKKKKKKKDFESK